MQFYTILGNDPQFQSILLDHYESSSKSFYLQNQLNYNEIKQHQETRTNFIVIHNPFPYNILLHGYFNLLFHLFFHLHLQHCPFIRILSHLLQIFEFNRFDFRQNFPLLGCCFYTVSVSWSFPSDPIVF